MALLVSVFHNGDSDDKRSSQYIHKRIDRFVRPPQALDLLDGVEHRRVVAAVIKSADLRQTPSAQALR
jgi:hypothetical protein